MPAKFVIVIWLSEVTVTAGKSFEAFARVENQGDQSGQVQVRIRDQNGSIVAQSPAVTIDAGKYADFTLTITAPTAVKDYTYTYEAYNVSTGAVDDTKTLVIHVTQYSASIENVVVTPTTVKPGDVLHVEFDYVVSPAPTNDVGLGVSLLLEYPSARGTGLYVLTSEMRMLPAGTSTLHLAYDAKVPDLGLYGTFTVYLLISTGLQVTAPALAAQYRTAITYASPVVPAGLITWEQLQPLIYAAIAVGIILTVMYVIRSLARE
jgi:hypothetical protein